MTIAKAITQLDALKHNAYSFSQKVIWLSRLDSMIKCRIIDTHEGAERVGAIGYDESTDPETVLLVPEPFDQMYLRWLEAQIDYANGEYGKYNQAIQMFETEYSGYRNYYNRNHMPLGQNMKYF